MYNIVCIILTLNTINYIKNYINSYLRAAIFINIFNLFIISNFHIKTVKIKFKTIQT